MINDLSANAFFCCWRAIRRLQKSLLIRHLLRHWHLEAAGLIILLLKLMECLYIKSLSHDWNHCVKCKLREASLLADWIHTIQDVASPANMGLVIPQSFPKNMKQIACLFFFVAGWMGPIWVIDCFLWYPWSFILHSHIISRWCFNEMKAIFSNSTVEIYSYEISHLQSSTDGPLSGPEVVLPVL